MVPRVMPEAQARLASPHLNLDRKDLRGSPADLEIQAPLDFPAKKETPAFPEPPESEALVCPAEMARQAKTEPQVLEEIRASPATRNPDPSDRQDRTDGQETTVIG